jgi:hypothetical protein
LWFSTSLSICALGPRPATQFCYPEGHFHKSPGAFRFTTFNGWREEDSFFAQKIEFVEAQAIERNLALIQRAALKDWKPPLGFWRGGVWPNQMSDEPSGLGLRLLLEATDGNGCPLSNSERVSAS